MIEDGFAHESVEKDKKFCNKNKNLKNIVENFSEKYLSFSHKEKELDIEKLKIEHNWSIDND